MKKRIISLILSIIFIIAIVPTAPAIAHSTHTHIEHPIQNGYELNSAVSTLIDTYFRARELLLNQGDTSALTDVAVEGIVEDELLHKRVLKESYQFLSYEIENIQIDDWHIKAYVTEETVSGEKVVHAITILKGDDELIIGADGYRDEVSNFNSASYLDDESIKHSHDHNCTKNTGEKLRSTCKACQIVQVAENEIGYLEKASNAYLYDKTANAGTANYTKYGEWYGLNGDRWCAIFVSWCANQVGVPTSTIPKSASCTTGMNTFTSWGVFHPRSSSYTPSVGDIFFVGTGSSATHTGIVSYVSSTYFEVIDGNYNDRVSNHSYSLTDTSIVGFAHPSYSHASSVYAYNDTTHWRSCSGCNATMSSASAHNFVYQSMRYVCSTCGYSTSSPNYPYVHEEVA